MLRNKQNKLDKIIEKEKEFRKSEKEPDEQQKAMIASKPVVKAEIKELEDLIQLYIDSNPNYNKKEEEQKVEEPKQVEAPRNDKHAFKFVAQVLMVNNAQVKVDGVADLAKQANSVLNWQFDADFNQDAWDKQVEAFANDFSNAVSNADMHKAVEEAAANLPIQKKEEPKKAEEPKVEAPAAQEEAKPAAEEKPAAVEEKKESIATEVVEEAKDGEAQQNNNNNRGNRRGRGERGRGRGNYRGNRNGREDADGFIEQTGEERRQRRGNYRGRGDRGNNRGNRDSARGGARPKDEASTQPTPAPVQQQQEQQ